VNVKPSFSALDDLLGEVEQIDAALLDRLVTEFGLLEPAIPLLVLSFSLM
jgi:hypothetical protein